MKELVIVESPSKAKTIEKYLGKNYHVLSSKGHIRDLAIKGKGGLGVDVDNGFEPTYEISKDKKEVVKQLYDQMPRPKVVVAVGVCACTGGVFKDCYNILGGADTVIPVDIYVPGCAARPQAIIDGIVQAVELFEKRSKEHDEMVRSKKKGSEVA